MKKVPVFVALVLMLGVFFTACRGSENSVMTGRCLVSQNGEYLIVGDGGEPIVMGNRSGDGALFRGLETGDKIEITCGEVLATYPDQTEVYSCKLLEKGSGKDVPQKVLDQLGGMGWKFVMPENETR